MTDPVLRQQRRMSRWMYALMWLGILFLLSLFFGDYLQEQYNPNQNLQLERVNGQQQVILQRNQQGHYIASGTIEGQPVVFLLDTGATDVAIPERIAKELGLTFGRASQVNTANGMTRTYETVLSSVSLGGITQYQVPAVIAPGFVSDAVLLGMSFLKNVEFTQRGETLIIRL
jgi:aspartyl protease family protein